MTDDELTTETPAMHHLSAQFSSILLTDRPPGRACQAAGLVVSQAKVVGSFARPPACLPAVANFTQSRHTPSNGGRRGEMRAKKKNRRSLSPRSDWAEPKVTERKNEKKTSPAADYHGRHHDDDDGIWLTTSYVSMTDFWSSRTCVVLTNDHNMSHDSIGQI